MPVSSSAGQPESSIAWFSSAAGQALLASEDKVLAPLLVSLPAPRWLWVAPLPATHEIDAYCVRLHPEGGGWSGPLRSDWQLPFASQSLGAIVLQHVPWPGRDADAFLAECARVLVSGGILYLLNLNPLSPYRWRWRGTGLDADEPTRWRRRLRRAGLAPDPYATGLGPDWRVRVDETSRTGPGLRAGWLLVAQKREIALTPLRRSAPSPLPQAVATT